MVASVEGKPATLRVIAIYILTVSSVPLAEQLLDSPNPFPAFTRAQLLTAGGAGLRIIAKGRHHESVNRKTRRPWFLWDYLPRVYSAPVYSVYDRQCPG
jgi:hypothetical protein